MSWNRFIILIVSIICLGGVTKLVIACAGGDDPYDAPSFFLNTINKQPAFVPFYYTPSLVFYTDGYDFDNTGFDDKLPDPNSAMWATYTGKQAEEGDIDSFIYKFTAAAVSNIYLHIRDDAKLTIPAEVRSNGLTKWLLKNKDVAAAQYLSFAKRCEPYTVPLEAVWDNTTSDYVTPKRDSAAMQALVNEAEQNYKTVKSDELKLRYAYQALRMSFYSRQYLQTINQFNTMITSGPDNFLYCRCLGLKAGALYKTGKKTEAAYLYSLAFDKSEENRKTIYTSFRWAVNGAIQPVLGMCKNDHERAVLYIMQGLYDYDINNKNLPDILQKAYSYDPMVKGLDIVLTRDINKIESDVIPAISRGTDTSVGQLGDLNAFAQRVGNENKRGDQAYWYLSAAYMYILNGNGPDCKRFLDKARAGKMTANEEDVHAIINVLYVMRKEKKITSETEEQLLPLLQASEKKEGTGYKSLFGNMMVMILKAAYIRQGDLAKAVYCYSKASGGGINGSWSYSTDYTDEPGAILESMTQDELHKAEAFIAQKNKSPFDAWLTAPTMYTAGALYELEGTKYIRTHEFDKAVAVLQKVPDSILARTTLPDALVSHIMDGQDLNRSDTAVTYNKLSFARKMLELQQTLKKAPADGRAAYQYANGLYNMSYYGKAHHAYDYYRSGTDEYAYFKYEDRNKLAGYAQERYAVQEPERYYMIAFENSTDKEIKARCLFMAAKCWQKNCPITKDKAYYDPDVAAYYKNTFSNPYFKQLKDKFKDTKFFSSATGTCSYFKDYVKKR